MTVRMIFPGRARGLAKATERFLLSGEEQGGSRCLYMASPKGLKLNYSKRDLLLQSETNSNSNGANKMSVQTLIDKAAEKVGNRHKLAKILQCTVSQVYDWRTGTKRCSPADRARLADLAGDDALQELVRATLEDTAGTPRGDQLKSVLGKLLRQTGEGLHTAAVLVFSVTLGIGFIDIPRCILC